MICPVCGTRDDTTNMGHACGGTPTSDFKIGLGGTSIIGHKCQEVEAEIVSLHARVAALDAVSRKALGALDAVLLGHFNKVPNVHWEAVDKTTEEFREVIRAGKGGVSHNHLIENRRQSSCVVDVPMVCEDHRDEDFDHPGCGGAGVYCQECMIDAIHILEEKLRVAEEALEKTVAELKLANCRDNIEHTFCLKCKAQTAGETALAKIRNSKGASDG